MVIKWLPTAAPPAFVAVTVMVWLPVTLQVKVTVSLRPLVFVTGDCPVACQTSVMGSVAVTGLTVAVKG